MMLVTNSDFKNYPNKEINHNNVAALNKLRRCCVNDSRATWLSKIELLIIKLPLLLTPFSEY